MNTKILSSLLGATLLVTLPFSAYADEEDVATPYVALTLSAYHGSASLNSQELYVEYPLNDSLSIFVDGLHSHGYTATYVGVAKSWDTGFTVAVGVGKNHYDSESNGIVAPWVSYTTNRWDVMLSAEYYTSGDPLYYQAWALRTVSERWSVGLYGETGFGVGPMLEHRFNEHVSVRVAAPVTGRHDASVLTMLVIAF